MRHLPQSRVRSAELGGRSTVRYPPVGLNLVQANGPGAGQSVVHFHIHLIPRNRDDELKMNWSAQSGDPNAIAAIAEKIRTNL